MRLFLTRTFWQNTYSQKLGQLLHPLVGGKRFMQLLGYESTFLLGSEVNVTEKPTCKLGAACLGKQNM